MFRKTRTQPAAPSANDEQIRRRADGSIDTAFYMDRGRRMRAQQARRFITLG